MPNHCNNTLIVRGKPKDINKMMKQVEITNSQGTSTHEASIFSCQKIIPRPSNQDNNWYEWNIANWGSKWGAYDIEVLNDDWENGEWHIYFQSAWSPLEPVIQALAKQHKKLSFYYSYYEWGCDFMGSQTYEKGSIVEMYQSEITTASCDMKEIIIGNHHFCQSCCEEVMCENEITLDLCEECEEKQHEEDVELWDKETEQVNVS